VAVPHLLGCPSLRPQMLFELHRRGRAATDIQAAWKGYLARKAFAPVWAAHQQAKAEQAAALVIQQVPAPAPAPGPDPVAPAFCQQLCAWLRALAPVRPSWRSSSPALLLWLQAWRRAALMARIHERQAALRVIARYLPMLRARLALIRMRRAAVALQRAWQQQLAVRSQAATQLQAATRGWLARRRVAAAVAGVVRLQALWRGHKVRSECGRKGREARAKLAAAAEAAKKQPQKQLGERARAALKVLVNSKQCSQVRWPGLPVNGRLHAPAGTAAPLPTDERGSDQAGGHCSSDIH